MNKPVFLSDLLEPESVLAGTTAIDKKELLQHLAAHAAQALNVEAHTLFDVLWEREKLGTTGVGGGIAIPHGRIDKIERVHGFFARLSSPISFDSIDQRPVDMVFLLLAPSSAGADHLHALAAVSRALRDTAFCEKLRNAKDAGALFTLLTQTDSPTGSSAPSQKRA